MSINLMVFATYINYINYFSKTDADAEFQNLDLNLTKDFQI